MSYNRYDNFVHNSVYLCYTRSKRLHFLNTTSQKDAKLATERTIDCFHVQRRYGPSMAACEGLKYNYVDRTVHNE